MTQSTDERSLKEVRAILRQLQRIGVEPETSSAGQASSLPPEAQGRPQARGSRTESESFSARTWTVIGGVVAACVAAAAGGVIFMKNAPLFPPHREVVERPIPFRMRAPAPEKEPAPSSARPANLAAMEAAMTGNVVDDARGLLEGGRVAAAREKLLLAPEKNSAAAMLVLARSYDPNVLQSIPGPDAGADVAEAERWYRRWREIATSEGLAIDPERFERIIRAMRRRGLSE